MPPHKPHKPAVQDTDTQVLAKSIGDVAKALWRHPRTRKWLMGLGFAYLAFGQQLAPVDSLVPTLSHRGPTLTQFAEVKKELDEVRKDSAETKAGVADIKIEISYIRGAIGQSAVIPWTNRMVLGTR